MEGRVTFEAIAQVAIAVFCVTAIWLSQDGRNEVRKWSPVLGLMGQPFWFYTTWAAEQWGIFALCFVYTWCWFKGLREYWGLW